MNAAANALSVLPGTAAPFASVLAMSRFLNHELVTLPALLEPAQEAIRDALSGSGGPVARVAHDWSMIRYRVRNPDRYQRSHGTDVGYERGTALVIETGAGRPLGPMALRVRTAREIVSTRPTPVSCPPGHVDELGPVFEAATRWGLGRPLVHVVDREADSVAHYRSWDAAGHTFVVRSDDRIVRCNGRDRKMSELVAGPGLSWLPVAVRSGPATVPVDGTDGTLWVCEVPVVLDRPGKRRVGKRRVDVPGEPLALRLVISWVLGPAGEVLAEWFLLTNAATRFGAAMVAQWYAWRWRIEGYHKLLKSAGMNAEQWQQETGEAVARRLVIASTACLSVWCLQNEPGADAAAVRRVLVRLSGRQMKWGVEHTAPARLAGLDKLLAVLDLMRTHDLEALVAQAQRVLPMLFDST